MPAHGFGGFGDVDAAWKIVDFKKFRFHTCENVEYGPVDISAQNLSTITGWLMPSDEVRAALKVAGC